MQIIQIMPKIGFASALTPDNCPAGDFTPHALAPTDGGNMPVVFAQGSSGNAIGRVQLALSKVQVVRPGVGMEPVLPSDQVDGVFVGEIRKAIQRAQKEKKCVQTGVQDLELWAAVLAVGTWPSEYEFSLGLVGTFERYDYTKAAGNCDQAEITRGSIGFTLVGWKDKK